MEDHEGVVMTPMLEEEEVKKTVSLRTVSTTASSLLTSDSVEDGFDLATVGFIPLDNISELSASEKGDDDSDDDTNEVGWYDPAYNHPDPSTPKINETSQDRHRASRGNALFLNI